MYRERYLMSLVSLNIIYLLEENYNLILVSDHKSTGPDHYSKNNRIFPHKLKRITNYPFTPLDGTLKLFN